MKKASIVSYILIVSLLVGGQNVFSNPKVIKYGFVQTSSLLAKGQLRPRPTFYTDGFCIKFLPDFISGVSDDHNLKAYKISQPHAIVNEGQVYKGLLRPHYAGLKGKEVDLLCGAKSAQISDLNHDGIIFSDYFFESEVKVILIPGDFTLSNPSEIRSLQDVGKSIKDKGKIGVLEGNESVKQVLKKGGISVREFPDYESLIKSMATGEIIGMSDDTIHVDEFIENFQNSTWKKVLKDFFILPSHSFDTETKIDKDELVAYSFAFRNDELGLRLKFLVDNILPNSNEMIKRMNDIRQNVNKMSGKLQSPSPILSPNPSLSLLERILKFLSSIFQTFLFKIIFVFFVLSVIPLPNSSKQKVRDCIIDLLMEELKSWLKPNSSP